MNQVNRIALFKSSFCLINIVVLLIKRPFTLELTLLVTAAKKIPVQQRGQVTTIFFIDG